MVPLLVLAAAAIVAGTLVWRQTMGRPIIPRLPRPEPPEAAHDREHADEAEAAEFVFSPAPRQEERPRRAFALVRLVLAVSVLGGAIAAGLYYLGYLVKLQLDRIFGS